MPRTGCRERTDGAAATRQPQIAARINSERIVLLGWSRAILLQLAHPLVAAGVADHSAFRAGPFAAARRLHQTVRSMLSLTFGSQAASDATIALINGIHRRVNGTLRVDAGRFPAGTRYSAEDTDLLLWVHATLLDSIPLVYDRVVAPLCLEDLDAYCLEAAWVPRALGARRDPPNTWGALQAYLAAIMRSGAIDVTRDARMLADAVLAPPFAPAVAPAAAVNRLVTVGLLPPDVREQYGFAWSDRQQDRLNRCLALLRFTRRWTPDRLALWPEAARRTPLPIAR